MSGQTSTRQTWIDALRLTAGLSMVGLHATADATGQPFPDAELAERVAPMLLRAVLYTARTELFLIISIFLLLQSLEIRPRGYSSTIAEQARRMLIPFVAWTLIYSVYGLIKADVYGYGPAALAELLDPLAWVGFLFLGDVKYHMHFIPTLFGLLLLFPLFRVAYRVPMFGLSVFACLLVKRELDAVIFSQFWGTDVLPYLVRAVKILTYAGYGFAAAALLGLWHRVTPQDRALWAPAAIFLGCLLFLIKLIVAHKTVVTGEWPFDYTPGYWADFLMPLVLFAICMSLANAAWPSVLSRLAPYSFGIYLCHPLFLDQAEILLRGTHWAPIARIAAKIAYTVPLTCVFVWGLSKLRALGWLVGLGPFPTFGPFRMRSSSSTVKQETLT